MQRATRSVRHDAASPVRTLLHAHEPVVTGADAEDTDVCGVMASWARHVGCGTMVESVGLTSRAAAAALMPERWLPAARQALHARPWRLFERDSRHSTLDQLHLAGLTGLAHLQEHLQHVIGMLRCVHWRRTAATTADCVTQAIEARSLGRRLIEVFPGASRRQPAIDAARRPIIALQPGDSGRPRRRPWPWRHALRRHAVGGNPSAPSSAARLRGLSKAPLTEAGYSTGAWDSAF
jgi:hypothetical protein